MVLLRKNPAHSKAFVLLREYRKEIQLVRIHGTTPSIKLFATFKDLVERRHIVA
jgi:hypothetical protein